jgi:hypothetical protein
MSDRRTIVRWHAGMEGHPLELVEGHIHQAWDRAFTSIWEVWPTPHSGFWHVWVNGSPGRATAEPLPGDLNADLLQEWGFTAERWRHWRAKARRFAAADSRRSRFAPVLLTEVAPVTGLVALQQLSRIDPSRLHEGDRARRGEDMSEREEGGHH